VNPAWEIALQKGDVEALQELINRGADVNALDRHGQSGLMFVEAALLDVHSSGEQKLDDFVTVASSRVALNAARTPDRVAAPIRANRAASAQRSFCSFTKPSNYSAAEGRAGRNPVRWQLSCNRARMWLMWLFVCSDRLVGIRCRL
jgi:hypothetical protein